MNRKVRTHVPSGKPYGFDDLMLGLLEKKLPVEVFRTMDMARYRRRPTTMRKPMRILQTYLLSIWKDLVNRFRRFIGRQYERMRRRIRVYSLDLADRWYHLPSTLSRYEEKGIMHIIHLAGKTFVPESWKNPELLPDSTWWGPFNVLEFCRKNNTGLTYIQLLSLRLPWNTFRWMKPSLKSYNPYSHSKLWPMIHAGSTLRTLTSGCRSWGLQCLGPGQPPHFIIPEIIEWFAMTGFPSPGHGSQAERDYILIDDPGGCHFQDNWRWNRNL